VFRRAPFEPDRHEEGIMVNTRIAFAALAAMLVATLAWSASNLNLSKSNVYRLTYPTDLLSATQAKAMLAELDKLGPADEARLKQWLPANFRRFGIAPDRVKKVVVLPRSREMKEIGIVLLTRVEDEAAAVATTVKGSKSNSDN
jgi:hypothetical protein